MSQRIGNLPANINIMNPVPNKDAKTIMKPVSYTHLTLPTKLEV